MSMFLSKDELQELTGFKAIKKQIEWLRARNYTFETTAAGKPKVLRDHVLHKMGGTMENHTRPLTQPDFSSIQ